MKGIDLISSSARLIGVLASGETLQGNEPADCLMILQQMLDAWQAERLNVYTININTFPLTPGQQVYTCGTGGNFNIARPARIERASIVNLNNPAQPLELPLEMLDDEGWQSIPVKAISSTLPQKFYDDGAFPLRNLFYWCIPSVAVNTVLYSWQPLSTFPDLNATDVTFPPAYLKAIRYNLAVDLAPEFGVEVPPVVFAQALQTKGVLRSLNTPAPEMRADPAVVNPRGRVYNWLTDLPAGR